MSDIDFVREAILDCDRCELRAQAKAPVPFSGPVPAANGIAIIAEAPGKDEDEAGEPLVGKAGSLLQDEVMRVLGVQWDECTKMNTASCYPGEIKTPTEEHMAACEMNKLAQLDLADPRWVLLCGRVALQGFMPHLSISQARGRPFRLEDDGPVFMATYHPSAALRKFDYLKAIREDLEKFKRMIDNDDWISEISDRCVVCADWMYFVDSTGIPWCEDHLTDEGLAWKAKLEADSQPAAVAMLKEAFPGAELVEEELPDPGTNAVGAHHSNAQDTEKAAAYGVLPRSGTQRRKVLEAVALSTSGLSDDEIALVTGIYRYSAAPRRNELMLGGWVEDSGQRRGTDRGADAIVWRLTDKGQIQYAQLPV